MKARSSICMLMAPSLALMLSGHVTAAPVDLVTYNFAPSTFNEDPAVPPSPFVANSAKLGTFDPSAVTTGVSAGLLDFGATIKVYVQDPTTSNQYRGAAIPSATGVPQDGVFVRAATTPTNLSDALTGSYLNLTLQATGAGEALKITEFSFDYTVVRTTGTTQIDGTVTLRSNVDGFTSNLGTTSKSSNSSTVVWGSTITYAITDPSLQQVAGPVEFRLYFHDNMNVVPNIHRLDNVKVRGEIVPIPEPTSIGLMLAAGAMTLVRRRSEAKRG